MHSDLPTKKEMVGTDKDSHFIENNREVKAADSGVLSEMWTSWSLRGRVG